MSSKKNLLSFLFLTVGLLLCLQINQSISAQPLELVVQTGHSATVNSIAFSPDGKLVASGGKDKTIKLWDVVSGQEINSFVIGGIIKTMSFLKDEKVLAIVLVNDNKIILWDIASSKIVKTLEGHTNDVYTISISPDGKTLASGSEDNTAKLWDINTGNNFETIKEKTAVFSVNFSPDGKLLSILSVGNNSVKFWDLLTGKEVETISGHSFPMTACAFSPDSLILASGSKGGTIKFWDFSTKKEIRTIEAHSKVENILFSQDGKILISLGYKYDSSEKSIKLWDVITGQEIKFLQEQTNIINSFAINPDGNTLAIGKEDLMFELYDLNSKRKIQDYKSHTSNIIFASFSIDGKKLITNSGDSFLLLKFNNNEIKKYKDCNKLFHISQDNKVIFCQGNDLEVKFIDIESEQLFKALSLMPAMPMQNFDSELWLSELSPDRKFFATTRRVGGLGQDIEIWDMLTGKKVRELNGFGGQINSIRFSPDSKTLASGDYKTRTVKLWDVATGKLLKSFSAKFGERIEEIADIVLNYRETTGKRLSSDGKFKLDFDKENNGRIKIIDAKTEIKLCTLIILDNDNWVVIDSEGRFDASDGALNIMHYSYGLQIINLEQFKDEYFEPGLLQKIFKGERLRAVVPLKDAKLPPEIVSQVFDVKTNKLVVKLKNRGGGFGAVKVFVNDKLAVADARDAKLKANPTTAQEFVELAVDLKNGAFVKGKICETKDGKEECRDNKITVYTSNYLADFKKSNITSRGTSIFTLGGGDENFKLPTLYAIVGGVSDYAGSDLDLKFAAKDAEDFSNALGLGARQLFCAKETPNCLDKVQITTLSTSGKAGTIQPTKENFRKAFAEIAQKAEPEDIVLIYLSGHGVSLDDTDTYFYLTADAASTSKEDLSKNFAKISITSNELLCWMTTTPCDADKALTFEGKPQIGNKALRQVIILDTCAAGKAGQTLALIAQKDLSTDQRRAIEFLKDKTGTHILMGSTADQPSYEASKFGQGLLTRALLEGMSGAALEKVNSFVDIQTLFRYAETRVEKLAVGIGGIQKPTNAAPTGKTFVIGQMMPNSQKQIAEILPREKPYILRPSFGNREDNYDILGINNALAKILNDQNNPLMQKGGEAVLVYLNEENFTGAIKPTGFYTIAGETVTVKVSLYKDGVKLGETFEVVANKNEIAEKLLAAIREKL